jgi:hypothetical protein
VDAPATWLVTREGRVHNATYGPHMTPPPATPDTGPATARNLNPSRNEWSC